MGQKQSNDADRYDGTITLFNANSNDLVVSFFLKTNKIVCDKEAMHFKGVNEYYRPIVTNIPIKAGKNKKIQLMPKSGYVIPLDILINNPKMIRVVAVGKDDVHLHECHLIAKLHKTDKTSLRFDYSHFLYDENGQYRQYFGSEFVNSDYLVSNNTFRNNSPNQYTTPFQLKLKIADYV